MNWKVYSIFSEKPEVDIILWKIKSRLKIIWFENLACMTQYKVQIVPRVFFLKGGEERDRDRVQPTRAEGCVTSQCLFKEEFWVSSDATARDSEYLLGSVELGRLFLWLTKQPPRHRKLHDWSCFTHLHRTPQNSRGFIIHCSETSLRRPNYQLRWVSPRRT